MPEEKRVSTEVDTRFRFAPTCFRPDPIFTKPRAVLPIPCDRMKYAAVFYFEYFEFRIRRDRPCRSIRTDRSPWTARPFPSGFRRAPEKWFQRMPALSARRFA